MCTVDGGVLPKTWPAKGRNSETEMATLLSCGRFNLARILKIEADVNHPYTSEWVPPLENVKVPYAGAVLYNPPITVHVHSPSWKSGSVEHTIPETPEGTVDYARCV